MINELKKLYIEATSRCNLNCRMCFRHTWREEKFGDLDFASYIRCIDDPIGEEVETVFFGGMGEPLVHPDLAKMISEASKLGKNVELITNGTLLTEQYIQALISAGLNELWVSIDEISDDYEKIQVGSNFSLIRDNLERFCRMRKGTGVRLGLTAVVMRDNIPHLRQIRDFAAHLDADDLNLSHMIPNRAGDVSQTLWTLCEMAEEEYPPANHDFYVSHHAPSYFDTSILPPVPENTGLELPLFLFRDRDATELLGDLSKDEYQSLFMWKGKQMTRRKNHCRFIEEGNCFIRWDGDVSPCMGVLHSANTFFRDSERMVWHHSFGNIHKNTLSEIWNCEAYSRFRDRVSRFDFSPCFLCGGCPLREENKEDCFGNTEPTCGACLWAQGFIVCP